MTRLADKYWFKVELEISEGEAQVEFPLDDWCEASCEIMIHILHSGVHKNDGLVDFQHGGVEGVYIVQ